MDKGQCLKCDANMMKPSRDWWIIPIGLTGESMLQMDFLHFYLRFLFHQNLQSVWISRLHENTFFLYFQSKTWLSNITR